MPCRVYRRLWRIAFRSFKVVICLAFLMPLTSVAQSADEAADALRQAMLKMLKSRQYSRPFYWAGFVVVGNGR